MLYKINKYVDKSIQILLLSQKSPHCKSNDVWSYLSTYESFTSCIQGFLVLLNLLLSLLGLGYHISTTKLKKKYNPLSIGCAIFWYCALTKTLSMSTKMYKHD